MRQDVAQCIRRTANGTKLQLATQSADFPHNCREIKQGITSGGIPKHTGHRGGINQNVSEIPALFVCERALLWGALQNK